MGELADDKIQCLECGQWYRSVSSHVFAAHGITARDYRLHHGIAITESLCGSDTLGRQRAAGRRVIELHPDLIERMKTARGPNPEPSVMSDEVRAAFIARRKKAVAAQWRKRFDDQGWESWDDAIDWAIDTNRGWADIAALIGSSETSVHRHAALAGAPPLDRRITPRQQRMLAKARERMAETGTLLRAPAELSMWLGGQRRLVAKGVRYRIHDELDRIDPEWLVPPAERRERYCSIDDCDQPRLARGLCLAHYQYERSKRARASAADRAEQLECLECGERFHSLGVHVRLTHGLSTAEYRARHDLPADVALNSAPLVAKRRAAASTPEALERVRQASTGRWGGTADELWAGRFERAGWQGWDDVVAWSDEHNVGWQEVADRLGCSKSKARARGQSAGYWIPPPLTDRQLHFIEVARKHVAEHGDLAAPLPADLSDWLRRTCRAEQRTDSPSRPNRCHRALDEIDSEWRTRIQRVQRSPQRKGG